MPVYSTAVIYCSRWENDFSSGACLQLPTAATCFWLAASATKAQALHGNA